MSFLNFFRRSKNTEPVTSVNTVETEPTVQVDRSLFVEDTAPEAENPLLKKQNPVEMFLDQDFEWLGYNDGYTHPEADYMEQKFMQLRSDFRLAVDKLMDSKRVQLGELRLHLIDAEGISPRLEAKLKERISQIEVSIHELDTQKILSIENEGTIAVAVNAYRLGFIKGLERYQNEKYFASSTGLFN